MTRLKHTLLALTVFLGSFLAVFLPATDAQASTGVDYSTWQSALDRNKVTVRPSNASSLLNNCVGTSCRAGWYTQQANKTWQIRTVPATAPVQNPGTVLPSVKPATPGVAAPKIGARIGGAATQAALAVTGVDLIYSSVGTVTHALTGTTSNGLWCDIQSIFNSAACQITAAPDYFINSDVSYLPPGWAYGTNVASRFDPEPFRGQQTVSAHVDVISAPIMPINDVVVELEVTLAASGSQVREPTAGYYAVYVIPLYRDVAGVLTRGETGVRYGFDSGQTRTLTVSWPSSARTESLVGLAFTVAPLDHNDVRVDYAPVSNTISRNDVTGTFIRWHPEGDPGWTPGTSPNPLRHFTTTSECIGSAGAYTTVTNSIPFYETDVEWPPLPDPDCGQDTLTSWKIDQITEGMDPQRIYEWELDPELQLALADMPQEQLSGNLQLELLRLDQTYEISCFNNPELCVEWFDDPARADNFVCRYGGELVPLEECFVYRPTFSYAKAKQGITHADEEGNLPEPVADPAPPGQNNSCPPPFQWSSLINPWYYYKSFTCALTEVFVPTVSPQARLEATQTVLQDSALGTIGRFFPLIPPLFDIGANRCGLLVDVELPTLNPLGASGNRVQVDTCSGIWAEAGPIRAILGASAIISGAFFALRIILKTIRVESTTEVAT